VILVYGATFGEVRINGISSNLQNNRRNNGHNKKKKRSFEKILHDEQGKEPEQPVIHSRLNITF